MAKIRVTARFIVTKPIRIVSSTLAVPPRFVMEKCKNAGFDTSYLGMDGQGFYYYLNAKSCATGFIQAGKGYDAQRRLLSTTQKMRPIIFLLEPQSSYHIYYWVLTGGEYCYSADDNAFYPKEIFHTLYPEKESGDNPTLAFGATDLGLSPSSFGKSFASLSFRLRETGADAASVNGKENDVLFLRLSPPENASSVQITFKSNGTESENACIICKTGEGTLLIPTGMNATWLLGDNSDISLRFLDTDGNTLAEIPLAETDYTFYEMKK